MPKKDKSRKARPTVEEKWQEKDEDQKQEYGLILRFTGGNYVLVKCMDEKDRRCHIRGTLQRAKTKATKMVVGDLVLLSIRDDKTGDIILRYPPDVARQLKKQGKAHFTGTDDDHIEAGGGSGGLDANNLGFDFDDAECEQPKVETKKCLKSTVHLHQNNNHSLPIKSQLSQQDDDDVEAFDFDAI